MHESVLQLVNVDSAAAVAVERVEDLLEVQHLLLRQRRVEQDAALRLLDGPGIWFVDLFCLDFTGNLRFSEIRTSGKPGTIHGRGHGQARIRR